MEPTMVENLQALKVLPLRFTLRAQTAMQLPRYKGSTLRGGFGTVFKETVCVVEHRDCTRCLLRARCAYPYVFDTPVPDDATRMQQVYRGAASVCVGAIYGEEKPVSAWRMFPF